jgi:hypothetical protein
VNEERLEAISRRAYTVMLRNAVNGEADVFSLVHDDVPALVKEARRLYDDLVKYGHHLDDCVFHLDDDSDLEAYGPNGVCTCGFHEATLPGG